MMKSVVKYKVHHKKKKKKKLTPLVTHEHLNKENNTGHIASSN